MNATSGPSAPTVRPPPRRSPWNAWPACPASPASFPTTAIPGTTCPPPAAASGDALRIEGEAEVPDSYAALAVVSESDLAALVPERMGRAFARQFGLTLFDPPYESPSVSISMVWHRAHGDNPGGDWLRRLIAEVAVGV